MLGGIISLLPACAHANVVNTLEHIGAVAGTWIEFEWLADERTGRLIADERFHDRSNPNDGT